MKTRMLRCLTRVALSLVAIAAWGTGATAQSLSGVYGGEGCSFKLTFRAKDVVYIQFIAGGEVQTEMPGQYKVDGDKVSVTAPSWGLVFTRKGDALEARYLGGPEVCTKLTGVSSARPQVARTPIPSSCDHFDWAYNRDNICFDTRPLLLTPTSKAKGSLGNPHSWSPQSQGALTLPWPADVSVKPWPVLLLLKVSQDGRTLEASGYFSSNVQTFTDAAVDMVMAKNLRWKPAQRNGEAVEAWVLLEVQPVFAGASGFISVNVTGGDELGTWVHIDRVFIGHPPVINYQVRAGPHTINVQIKGPSYREVNDTVQVGSGTTVVKSYDADPLAPAPQPPKPKPSEEQQLVAPPPRSTLVVGIDVGDSFRQTPYFNDAIDFAALYIYGHVNGLGGLKQATDVFVGSLGGDVVGQPKTFHPIQDLTGKSPEQIAASLRAWFPETDPITDYNGFFERTSVHIRRQNLVLAPLSVVMFTDGLPDFPGAGRLTPEARFGRIDMSPLEYLSRSVTLRVLYVRPVVAQTWEQLVKRQRVRVWTQDADIMNGWRRHAIPGAPLAQQDSLLSWMEKIVDFQVRRGGGPAAAGGERDTNASQGGRPNVGVEPPITPKPAPSSSDLSSALLTAKAIVDGASYDSTRARQLQLSGDSATLTVLRAAYANRLDSARTYLAMALASPDTALRTSAAAILLQGGAKLGRANIWDHAYPWLDETLQLVVPRAPSDTTGPRQQIRIQASFWYGLSSVPTLNDQYRAMVNSRSCTEAKTVSERIARTKEALMLGMRVHPPTVNQMLQTLGKFENQMPRVKATFGCDNF